MTTIAFRSQPLPSRVSRALHSRLHAAHAGQPFSAADPRQAARRAGGIAEELGLAVTVFRGGLDLCGSEVDHIWLDVEGRVIDVAFPLFVPEFVERLRQYVAGEIEAEQLAAPGLSSGLEHRVLGEFPAPLQYRGQPVWSARH